MAVTASLAINFGDTKDIFLEAEILDADNEGKTSFVAGDTVYFRVYCSGSYNTPVPTIGSVSSESTGNIANIKSYNDEGVAEDVTFTFSGTASTNKLIYGDIISYDWIGTQLSEIKKSGFNEVSGGLNPITKKADKCGVAKIDYNTIYDLWAYSSPATVGGSSTYSVVIGITATA